MTAFSVNEEGSLISHIGDGVIHLTGGYLGSGEKALGFSAATRKYEPGESIPIEDRTTPVHIMAFKDEEAIDRMIAYLTKLKGMNK
jgi:hypothetical protein